MKNPKLTIELVHNGAIIEIKDHVDFHDGNPISLVYEFDEDNKKGLLALLQQVDEFLIVDESPRDKERADIKLVHGYEYECTDADCEICKEAKHDM
jgi:hypothetical protein